MFLLEQNRQFEEAIQAIKNVKDGLAPVCEVCSSIIPKAREDES